jgi:hypothetical protein
VCACVWKHVGVGICVCIDTSVHLYVCAYMYDIACASLSEKKKQFIFLRV